MDIRGRNLLVLGGYGLVGTAVCRAALDWRQRLRGWPDSRAGVQHWGAGQRSQIL